MVILIIGLIVLIILISFFLVFFIIPLFFGAPFDISRKQALKNMLILTSPKRKDKIAELGSGDGRVCIALARKNKNAEIHGFEINPFLVMISRKKIKKLNLDNQIEIHWKNFWKVNFRFYNKIVLFQYRSIMNRLEKKLRKELRPKAKVISHNWTFPTWRIKKELGKHGLLQGTVYLYEK